MGSKGIIIRQYLAMKKHGFEKRKSVGRDSTRVVAYIT